MFVLQTTKVGQRAIVNIMNFGKGQERKMETKSENAGFRNCLMECFCEHGDGSDKVHFKIHAWFKYQKCLKKIFIAQCYVQIPQVCQTCIVRYSGADKSLARPTSRCILFDGENISFYASLVIYINSTNIPSIMIINRIYEHQNLLSL